MKLFSKEPSYYATPGLVRHDFYITDEITEASDYCNLLQALHTAHTMDEIYIHINSPGGDFYTACQIAYAIENSKAGAVVCSAEGLVASAATMIFLATDCWEVSPYSTFMFHTSSGMSGGKLPDTKKNILAHEAHINTVCQSVYGGFFSEEEIDEIINQNQDKWLTAEEVYDRLQKVTDLMKKAQEEADAKVEAVQKVVQEAGLDVNVKAPQ